jgi:hypothetical protein
VRKFSRPLKSKKSQTIKTSRSPWREKKLKKQKLQDHVGAKKNQRTQILIQTHFQKIPILPLMKKKMNITSVHFFLELLTPLNFLFTLEVTKSIEPIYHS